MRLPTLSSLVSPTLSNSISEMRSQISKTSQEAVTGRQSDLTQHLKGRVGVAMISSKAVEDIGHQREHLTLRENRLDIIQQNLTTIQEASQNIDTALLAAIGINDQAGIDASGRDAANALEQVLTTLNTRLGGRYLFAGDATATQPFAGSGQLMDDIRQIATDSSDAATYNAALDTYFNDPAGPWQTTIYAGEQTVTDPDSLTGVDPAITRLVSSLATIALASPGEDIPLLKQDLDVLGSATNELTIAKSEILNLRALRGVTQQNIALQQESLNAEETILSAAFNGLTAKDQYEAASELKELEANLEAAYLLTTRLSSLSLLNFMR